MVGRCCPVLDQLGVDHQSTFSHAGPGTNEVEIPKRLAPFKFERDAVAARSFFCHKRLRSLRQVKTVKVGCTGPGHWRPRQQHGDQQWDALITQAQVFHAGGHVGGREQPHQTHRDGASETGVRQGECLQVPQDGSFAGHR